MNFWQRVTLGFILLLAFGLRTYAIQWDDGYHFHPDERHIVMVAEKLEWVSPFEDPDLFFKVDSPMNPQFFAYGSLPIYLLAVSGWIAGIVFERPQLGQYAELPLTGRVLSALFDTGTVLMVYLIVNQLLKQSNWSDEKNNFITKIFQKIYSSLSAFGGSLKTKFLEKEWLGLMAASLYAICVLPIQLSHFYAVDTLLTFLGMLVVWMCLRFLANGNMWILSLIGVFWGMAMATKANALVLGLPIGIAILGGIFKMYNSETDSIWNTVQKKWFTLFWQLSWSSLVISIIALLTFAILEPYGFIDWQTFIKNHQEQSRMTHDAWTFPYTLQYVDTPAYGYHLENIIRFGMGYGLGWLSILGIVVCLSWLIKQGTMWLKSSRLDNQIIDNGGLFLLLIYIWVYFGIVGNFAVKFMRYMLPIYPIFVVLGVCGLYILVLKVGEKWRNSTSLLIISGIYTGVLIMSFTWLMAFMRIYEAPNTRIQASIWLRQHLDLQDFRILGIEHWDDALPVPPWHTGFIQVSLPLYERDTSRKWQEMSQYLSQVDAVVLASNRLSAPLTRLHKYEITGRYYEKLFNGELGFVKAAEFTQFPGIGNWQVNTQEADESFQVYDHPRVTVFVKETVFDSEDYYRKIWSEN